MLKLIPPQFMKPASLLRLGLALTFVYAGVMAFLEPAPWLGFVPGWVENIVAPEIFLSVHAVFQIMLGAALIVEFIPQTAAMLAVADLAAILIFYGIDLVTFRDLGLFFAALALVTLTTRTTSS
ncbi:MAG: hypothetical protein Q8P88_02685 [Candidatus Jorgensenbacteria bacterium]|nr:hypothetical protein [Candidatus Jorgensenbacteria bacterium]